MITFVKKADPQPVPNEVEENRFERIRKAAKEGHRRSYIEDTGRRARKTDESDQLLL